MNTDRILQIIILELTNDALKLETELEATINSDLDINKKVILIKELLNKMVGIDASLTKFNNMTKNNTIQNKEDNETNK